MLLILFDGVTSVPERYRPFTFGHDQAVRLHTDPLADRHPVSCWRRAPQSADRLSGRSGLQLPRFVAERSVAPSTPPRRKRAADGPKH